MTFEIFKGEGPIERLQGERQLPLVDRRSQEDPEGYSADPDLRKAVNVAIWLGMPLLVTGDPGTGKTQLAYRVAKELGLEEPLKFETKSSSIAQDLFYTYDAVRRFSVAQLNSSSPGELDPRNFITYQALGLAILNANEKETVRRWLPEGQDLGSFRPRRSVVLIDEMDKAPRDFPNDLLNEIDRRAFRVPELGPEMLTAPEARAPIVIVTSNSEKQLPDAFLRRCVYHHIEFPGKERLADIVSRRLPDFRAEEAFVKETIEFFLSVRESGVAKKPSTAELLNLLTAFTAAGVDFKKPYQAQAETIRSAMSTVIKTHEDLVPVTKALDTWCQKQKQTADAND